MRSHLLDDAVHGVSVGTTGPARAAKRAVKAVLRTTFRRELLATVQAKVVYSSPPAPDPELMASLRSRLRPEVERFSAYLGRDLVSLWGYADA